jgi:hypothetical protein
VSHEAEGPFTALETAAARQACEEAAAKTLAAAKVRLILGRDAKSAFFATLALRLKPEPNWEVETIATDGTLLEYCPRFVTGLSPDELEGVIAHEVMHSTALWRIRVGVALATRCSGTSPAISRSIQSCATRV